MDLACHMGANSSFSLSGCGTGSIHKQKVQTAQCHPLRRLHSAARNANVALLLWKEEI